MPTFTVTDETFRSEVLESELPVLVDFWAQWCGPCHLIAPVLEELSEDYADRMRFAKLDTMANPDVPMAYGVLSLPTLNVYRGGELVRSIIGARPKRALIDEIDAALQG